MNLQEMLTTESPDSITDADLKKVSYGLVHGEFDAALQTRQWMLQARLAKIEKAKEIAMKQCVNLPNLWEDYQDDSDDDDDNVW